MAMGQASATNAKTFPTPEAAAQALIAAAKSGDQQAILEILGSDAKDIISTGDEVQDKEAAAKFLASAQQKMHLEQTDEGAEIMNIGADDWPFPIPIVKKGMSGPSTPRQASRRCSTGGSAPTSSRPSMSADPLSTPNVPMRARSRITAASSNTPGSSSAAPASTTGYTGRRRRESP
jgi:hypothetical protein